MQDVTDLCERYRRCAAALWNDCLRNVATIENDVVDRFEELQRLLFQTIVLDVLGVRHYLKTSPDEPCSFLRVVPKAEVVPVMIQSAGEDGSWEDPSTRLAGEDVDFRFIDYFDWDTWGRRGFLYYRVRIAACGEHPLVVGRQALIEVERARVVADPDAPRHGPTEAA